MKKLALTLAILTLASCGGSGGGDGSFTSEGKLAKLEGVWKSNVNEGTDGIDEGYLVFTKEGLLTVYDYAGDTYDNFGNCYWINNAQITHKSGDTFEVSPLETNPDPDDIFTVTITVSGNTMTTTFDDEPAEKLMRSSLKESDLTPECDETSLSLQRIQSKGMKRIIQ